MPGTLTYFLSDLHLGARYIAEPREHEMRVVRWLDSIKHNAKRIFLLGDILDYWYEYRYVVPRGHVRFLGKLAELADSGVEITWMTGNHDIWLFDYLSSELGIKVVDGPVKFTIGACNYSHKVTVTDQTGNSTEIDNTGTCEKSASSITAATKVLGFCL